MSKIIIAKVGGSLFDLPDLRERLTRWLASLPTARVVFIAGGGELADVVRNLHRTHHLREETSHWLAIRTMSVNAHFLGAVLNLPVTASTDNLNDNVVLDPLPFFQADEGRPGALPHTWKVTSDSMAARVAQLAEAELVLLKSATPPDLPDWEALAMAGYVDRQFPEIVEGSQLKVNCVNLRALPG